MYNFGVYESCTCRGFCCPWDKVAAKRGEYEISTYLHKWLTSVDELNLAKTVAIVALDITVTVKW